jgi:CDP-paratose 2-epimerase
VIRVHLVTGGAGFVGSHLALALRSADADARIVAFDNLRRRGAELNVGRLRSQGVEFVHGDIRLASDLEAVGRIDSFIDCSAEPSVVAGSDGQPRYLIDSNLGGLINCLELARRHDAALLFLSTSRVYPVAGLSALRTERRGRRLELLDAQPFVGASAEGINESFPLDGARTLYGATKLAGELLIAEYVAVFGLRALINRCGVIAGPWQMGRVDQGVFALWMFAHVLGRPLNYIGYGGSGCQVRDVLHVDDLVALAMSQLAQREQWRGDVYNVGGGRRISASLAELTDICVAISGNRIPIGSIPAERPGDVPIYLTDSTRVRERYGWTPTRDLHHIMTDLHEWSIGHQDILAGVLE